MAVTIQIPSLSLPENLSQTQVIWSLIDELGPYFVIYAISFFVIAIYWISYHQIFNHIVDSHTVIVWLNLVFLFFITLVPFVVDLGADYSSYQIIFVLYALVLSLAGLLLSLIWLHASKNRLVSKSLSHVEIKYILLESILVPSVFAISILVSAVDVEVAYYFWLIIIPGKIFIRRKYRE